MARMMVSRAHQTAYCGDEVIDLPLVQGTGRSRPVDVDRVLIEKFYPATEAEGKKGEDGYKAAQPERDFTLADALNLELMEAAPAAAAAPAKPGKPAAPPASGAPVDGNK